MHREVRLARLERQVLRDGPRHEDRSVPVHHLQSQIEVQPARVMLVDHEGLARRRPPGVDVSLDGRRRLRGLFERPLCGIGLTAWHSWEAYWDGGRLVRQGGNELAP